MFIFVFVFVFGRDDVLDVDVVDVVDVVKEGHVLTLTLTLLTLELPILFPCNPLTCILFEFVFGCATLPGG